MGDMADIEGDMVVDTAVDTAVDIVVDMVVDMEAMDMVVMGAMGMAGRGAMQMPSLKLMLSLKQMQSRTMAMEDMVAVMAVTAMAGMVDTDMVAKGDQLSPDTDTVDMVMEAVIEVMVVMVVVMDTVVMVMGDMDTTVEDPF